MNHLRTIYLGLVLLLFFPLFGLAAQDVYEIDNSMETAKVIGLNSQDSNHYDLPGYIWYQKHNFFEDGDVDWVKFYAIQGEIYKITACIDQLVPGMETVNGSKCDPAIEIYDSNGEIVSRTELSGITRFAKKDDYGLGINEWLEWQFETEGIYYIKIYQCSDTWCTGSYGDDTEYNLTLVQPYATFNSMIYGNVSVVNATLKTTAIISGVLPDPSSGNYFLPHIPGKYTFLATASGYETFKQSFDLGQLAYLAINPAMVPLVVDECPTDPNKTKPGICGCNVPDIDTDGDQTYDCHDGCKYDKNKTSPGACGCDVPDTDTDGDTVPDCNDACKNDPKKTEPGLCGCDVPDTDTDGDTVPDCNDACKNDPKKTEPGLCGCDVPDTDTDGDTVPDCNDACKNDPKKTDPGLCGCDVPDTDTDDTVQDCNDACKDDPNKTEPGLCGCGKAETPDSDHDGVPDCNDECRYNPYKIEAGVCGCWMPDQDSDGDLTLDCEDNCPFDKGKIEPGLCGCGKAETPDSDHDGVVDCNDQCPDDPQKTEPKYCGCGNLETDTDKDNMPDCVDGCPDNPDKHGPGVCGCDVPDPDSLWDFDENGNIDLSDAILSLKFMTNAASLTAPVYNYDDGSCLNKIGMDDAIHILQHLVFD